MRYKVLWMAALAVMGGSGAHAQDVASRVARTVQLSTLDQPGTHPFHLKAEFAPSLARDKSLGRTGSVEIWWISPTKWRREIQSNDFDQLQIVDGAHTWQSNSASYFPEWLREVAVALVEPVPDLDLVLAHVKTGEVRDILGATHISWVEMGTDGTVSKGLGQGIDLNNGGPLFVAMIGSSADLKDPSNFHGRQIARRVSASDVTARVSLLEDLKDTPAGFFDTARPDGDPLLQTVVVKERSERANVIQIEKTAWPVLPIGPIEGVMMFEVVIDRDGKVHEIESYLSDNPGLRQAAEAWVRGMRFHPYMVDGVPAQVVTTITLPFKTTRPPGVEMFPPSKDIFDTARKLSFPAASGVSPYVLKAEFTAMGSGGQVLTGTYTDTWLSDTQWRRQADFGKSRLIRSRNGEKRYLLSEGPDSRLLGLVFETMEPIPDTTSWFELEWLVVHDTVDGVRTLRISRGPVTPDGVLASETQGLWVDESGRLVKTHERGTETTLTMPSDFAGMQVARRIEVRNQGKLAMRVDITGLTVAGSVDPAIFTLKGHDWVRQFTPEVR